VAHQPALVLRAQPAGENLVLASLDGTEPDRQGAGKRVALGLGLPGVDRWLSRGRGHQLGLFKVVRALLDGGRRVGVVTLRTLPPRGARGPGDDSLGADSAPKSGIPSVFHSAVSG
jgi:hypothetical protein